MRITRLRVRNLRRHLDLDLELAAGLTVIRGPNESGKSTILRALELGLAGDVGGSGDRVEDLRSWGAAEDGWPWIRLEFEEEEEDGVQAGWVEKRIHPADGAAAVHYRGTTVDDPAAAAGVLADLTGIPSARFFQSTAAVRHREIDDVARDDAALRDRLHASISGGDRATVWARRKLERLIRGLAASDGDEPGRLDLLTIELDRAREQLEAGEARLSALETVRERLIRARERRQAAHAVLDEARAGLEGIDVANRVLAQLDAARERFKRYGAAAQLSDEVALLEASRPWSGERAQLVAAVERLKALEASLAELEAQRDEEARAPLPPEPVRPGGWRVIAAIAVMATVGAIALAAIESLAGLHLPLPPLVISQPPDRLEISGAHLVAALLALAAAVLVPAALWRLGRLREHERADEARKAEVESRLRARAAIEMRIAETAARRAEQLDELGRPDLAGAEALIRELDEHAARSERVHAQLASLVGDEAGDVADLAGLRDAAAAEMEDRRAALEGLGPLPVDAAAREAFVARVAGAEEAIQAARDEESELGAAMDHDRVDAEEVAALAELLASLGDRAAVMQRRLRVYRATLGAIETAERATLRTATRYLERNMARDIERVTAGRYRQVQVDDDDLAIRVFSPDRGDWVDVSSLSQGTLDLVYLAARIALVRLVTGLRRPPLVLDDPFVSLDDARAGRTLELLRDISRDFQVIYLTTSDRYDAAADAVRVLDP